MEKGKEEIEKKRYRQRLCDKGVGNRRLGLFYLVLDLIWSKYLTSNSIWRRVAMNRIHQTQVERKHKK